MNKFFLSWRQVFFFLLPNVYLEWKKNFLIYINIAWRKFIHVTHIGYWLFLWILVGIIIKCIKILFIHSFLIYDSSFFLFISMEWMIHIKVYIIIIHFIIILSFKLLMMIIMMIAFIKMVNIFLGFSLFGLDLWICYFLL